MMIELSNEEALIFRALAEANGLDVKGGSVLMQFDTAGRVYSIEVRRYTKIDRLSTGDGETLTIVV